VAEHRSGGAVTKVMMHYRRGRSAWRGSAIGTRPARNRASHGDGLGQGSGWRGGLGKEICVADGWGHTASWVASSTGRVRGPSPLRKKGFLEIHFNIFQSTQKRKINRNK
jgi:hypothetical protein